MLDPKYIRANLDLVKDWARKKRVKIEIIDNWLKLDDQRKKLQQEFDEKRAEQNKASAEIGKAADSERGAMIAKVWD